MQTLRTFVALVLPEDACRVLEQEQRDLADQVIGVKWVSSRTVHVTLVFLGSTPAAAIAEIGTVMQQATERCGPIDFTLQGLGAFPHARSPKVLWAGMRNCDALLDLQGHIADGLATLGFQKDKKQFCPHITLGRVRDGSARRPLGTLLDERQNQKYGDFLADRLAFVQSDLQPSGPVYKILEECTL